MHTYLGSDSLTHEYPEAGDRVYVAHGPFQGRVGVVNIMEAGCAWVLIDGDKGYKAISGLIHSGGFDPKNLAPEWRHYAPYRI